MSALAKLDERSSLSEKMKILHGALQGRFDFLDHMSVALYDPATDYLKTFLDSANQHPVMNNYQAKLADTPGLRRIVQTGNPRVIDDLEAPKAGTQTHTHRILQAGYRSSYTMPMFAEGSFYGFVFFNSSQPGRFAPDVVAQLDPFGRLLALMVVCELQSIRKLTAATRTLRHVTSRRDCETGAHLERMSRYSRLIAQELSEQFALTDEYIEHVYLFAPMHDIGKIAIPDHILLKEGPLNEEEWVTIRTHPESGLDMVNYMVEQFELDRLTHVNMLRNIVYCHHEWIDGSGYPQALRGDNIPLEARIVTTADVFDALTSRRPYKEAWNNDAAFGELRAQAGHQLDARCVDALIKHIDTIEALQAQFTESVFG